MPSSPTIISDISEVQDQINTIAESLSSSVVSIIIAKDFQTYYADPF